VRVASFSASLKKPEHRIVDDRWLIQLFLFLDHSLTYVASLTRTKLANVSVEKFSRDFQGASWCV
jgi:hypothetical protein